ncbi:MAG: hypothetical protein QOD06_686 [Candidatus Binatota bacterium]|jgi:HAD superfamily hydrolase (TIGR01509 family)|nr:hypothetical protein [Candidatus Binatota bacterium]
MATTRPAAILFDLDGVIVDSEPLHHRAFEQALERTIPFDLYAEVFTARGDGLEYAQRTWGADRAALFARKQEFYRVLLHGEARLRPGAATAIAALAEVWPLGLATNSPRGEAEWVLDRFGLAEHFRAVVGREDYARGKPAPDPFLRVAALLGAPTCDCLVVEDAAKGVRSAIAAGTTCVVVPNDYTRGSDFSLAHAVLASFDELTPETVRRVVAARIS